MQMLTTFRRLDRTACWDYAVFNRFLDGANYRVEFALDTFPGESRIGRRYFCDSVRHGDMDGNARPFTALRFDPQPAAVARRPIGFPVQAVLGSVCTKEPTHFSPPPLTEIGDAEYVFVGFRAERLQVRNEIRQIVDARKIPECLVRRRV